MSKITIGILTYNRKDALLKAIQSAYDQNFPDMEVLVVDSNSSDGTAEAVRERFPDVRLILLPRNLGCPGGRNHIYANAKGDFIVNLDDDAYFGDGALKRLVETFESDSNIGIVSMGVRFIEEHIQTETIDETWYEVGCFHGGASAVRKSMIVEIGDFPHDFFLFQEEQHLSIRAMSASYKIVERPSCFIWHPIIAGLTGKHRDYFRYRNTLLVVMELFPGWLLVKYLFLRIGSNALISLRRGTIHKYLAAVASVLWRLPLTLLSRRPCSADAVSKYFRLR